MLDAFLKIISTLEVEKLPYCIIGGIALLLYGGRTSTIDLDFYFVAKNRKKLISVLEALGAEVHPRGEFQYQGIFRGFRFDVLVADRWVGLPALKRAKKVNFGNIFVQVATPEDLIIMKTLADRPMDRRDVQELRELFKSIDESYIESKLNAARKALLK